MLSFLQSKLCLRIVFVCVYVFLIVFGYLMTTPYSFPEGYILTVHKGESLGSVAQELKEQQLIHSPALFKAIVYVLGGEHSIFAGQYYFEQAAGITTIAQRLITGDRQLALIPVTIPEGSTNAQIADILKTAFPEFNTTEFLKKTEKKEGYLFPETYFFYPDASVDTVITTLEQTFKEELKPLETKITQSKKTKAQIITMASILEREAQNTQDWHIISGILWKRIAEGMPLQVDATFYYERGLGSFDLSLADLRTDSAYNTYTNKGLPPTPIANPGIATITAALEPIITPYWYYLSDKTGKMHYAKTHDEHVANKNKYLR